jgi:cellulose synthase/poly-beta-1,6-N-acetylglucosamine synthase-like glycosyltransferase
VQTPLKVGVVVPARNEEEQLAKSLGRIPDHLDGVGSLVRIVVDDGSTDATAKIARSINWAVISHPVSAQGGIHLSGVGQIRGSPRTSSGRAIQARRVSSGP